MNSFKLTTTLLLAALAAPLLLAACESNEPQDRDIQLEIQDGALVAPTDALSVNQDDTVTLTVTSDQTVSFHLHGYDLEQQASSDAPAVIMFDANATGSFPFTIHTVVDEHDDSPEEGEHNGEHEGEEVELGRLDVQPR